MLISIIIPAYNTEPYIGRCLESVCSQTYNDIEILIIDDASSDGTKQIINNYSKKDKRIKVFSHKRNKGNGAGRNMAIKEAKGEYIMFVDSDDRIATDAIYKLVNSLDGSYPNVVMYGCYWNSIKKTGKERLSKQILPDISGKESKELLLNMLLTQQKGFLFSPWIYFCRRKFLLENNVMFDDSSRYFEDVIFTTKLVYYTNSISVVKEALYFYTVRNDSIMGCTSKKKISDRVCAVLNIRDFLKYNGIFDMYRDAYTFCFVHTAFFFPFRDYVKLNEKDNQIENFFYDLSQEDAIRKFNASGLKLPNEVKDKEFRKRSKMLTSNVWLISHHFNFSLKFLRMLSRFQ